MSPSKFCTAERSTLRPMRPKPLIPTLIAMSRSCKERRGKDVRKGEKHAILAVLRPRFQPRRAFPRHENDATPAPRRPPPAAGTRRARLGPARPPPGGRTGAAPPQRSEERRVGKEWRSGGAE